MTFSLFHVIFLPIVIIEQYLMLNSFVLSALIIIRSNRQEYFADHITTCCEMFNFFSLLFFFSLLQNCSFESSYETGKLLWPQSEEQVGCTKKSRWPKLQ